ncbi:cyclin-dependent kinase 2-associated protein 2-like [Belonocnema kinseyi]|uniref:cyclin-dependent kinase 2-associated protein 2-like n=1 Tax=Belonocnema kinseyi TaxID=2817044 RepID=UPI00143D5866|nr:cyclin-dependent kinase 2-associated protein 2-like [Belonocnema kinseyi]
MEKGPIEAPIKISEPLITIPNPRALQRERPIAQATVPSVPGQPNYSQLMKPAEATVPPVPGQSKYTQLLNVIEELGSDIRPAYASSRSSAERIKRGLVHARMLVKECLAETEKSARQ